jgi:hypothetical protein
VGGPGLAFETWVSPGKWVLAGIPTYSFIFSGMPRTKRSMTVTFLIRMDGSEGEVSCVGSKSGGHLEQMKLAGIAVQV